MSKKEILLEVSHLKKYFPMKKGLLKRQQNVIKAVDDVSFHIYKGETLGIVGESGSGKSTLGRAIIQLIPRTGGDVYYNGQSIHTIQQSIQMIFQNPDASLNPRFTVGQLIEEPFIEQTSLSKIERQKRVDDLLEKVGLNKDAKNKFPHAFSGGQKQRIGIARALAMDPQFIIADEPVSALDVSVQAHILNLLTDLQHDLELTYLFISHDLSVVKYISDRVAVMYSGQIVEIGNKNDIYNQPLHPYTEILLQSIPTPNVNQTRKKINWANDTSAVEEQVPGCPFYYRCPHAFDKCFSERPALKEKNNEHAVACHLYE
ncbi:MAG TPA: oligopeptide/dipeptide ABC transporter ATP-binding protein [Bacillota bacterium]|nr:oligopeptide/dipeptide ABC transporter ATP-binding protein [Bacillota bacterium]